MMNWFMKSQEKGRFLVASEKIECSSVNELMTMSDILYLQYIIKAKKELMKDNKAFFRRIIS